MSSNNSSFKVRENPALGRFIIAKKKFTMTDVILDEPPILMGPLGIKGFNHDEGQYNSTSIKTCLGCFKIITEIPTKCSRCGWWVCSKACSDEPFHARYECILFKKNKIRPSNPVAFGRLNIIRGCIMYKDKNNPQNWKDFTTLSSQLNRQSHLFKALLEREIFKATEWINEECELDVDESIVGLIVRTFIVNGFSISGQNKDGSTYKAELLYKTGSMFCHSCSANAEWCVLPTNENGIKRWNLRIYALRNISVHDSINIQYYQDFVNSDTPTRQKFMEDNYNFFCRCERCMDKTEFNFYLSALRCSECGNAKVLPDDLSDEMSTWTCDVCGECKDSSLMKSYIKDYEDILHYHIRTYDPGNPMAMELSLEMLISSATKRNLTNHHRVIIRSMYYWLKLQKFDDLLLHTKESRHKFVKILKRAKQCVEVFKMFGTLRSIALLDLVCANAIAAYYFKSESLCSIEYLNYSPQEIRQIVSAIDEHLKIATKIMGLNPYCQIYTNMLEEALPRSHFWKKTLQDIEFEDHTISLNEPVGDGVMRQFEKLMMYLGTFWSWIWARQSGEYNPDMSLLTRYNFNSKN